MHGGDELTQVQKAAVRLLESSPKSRKELADRLTRKGYESGVIRQALDTLEQKCLLSDRALARDLFDRFSIREPSGRNRIDFELKRRGISSEIRVSLLDPLDAAWEQDQLTRLGRERWARVSGRTLDEKKKKLYRFLLNRGFEAELAEAFIRALPETVNENRRD